METNKTRAMSQRQAKLLGVHVPDTLPFLDDTLQLRAKDAIMDRLLCMHATAAVAYGLKRERALHWLKHESLGTGLTSRESDFLRLGIGDAVAFQLRIEGMWALAWVLSLVEELDFAHGCSNQFANMLPSLKSQDNAEALRHECHVRPIEQVISSCDLAYCLHWAIRHAQLLSLEVPRTLKDYIVIERRHALEWCLSSEAWDEITLDT